MKYLTKIFFISISIIIALASCTKNFEEINTDPNNATTTDANYVFNYVIKEGAGEYGFVNNYNYNYMTRWCMQTSAVWGNSTMPPYTLFDQYRIQNLWEYYYSKLLLNCKVLEKLTADNPDDLNKHQVARIWKIYCFHRITDTWGDVPYSDAWKLLDEYSESNIKPVYDKQEDIYKSMIAELKEAADNIDDSKPFYSNDMLYNGDLEKWRKFANSLRLRLSVRSGNQEAVSEIVNANNLISDNSENALFSYIESQDWWNPYYGLRQSSPSSVPKISELMKKQLDETSDPRLPVYAEPTELNGSYVGVPNLMDAIKKENQAMGIGVTSTSYIGTYFTDNKEYINPILTYSEVCFLRAEAALRGWTSDNPQTMYENGVTASMEYYNIPAADITEFLTNGEPYNGTIEQIIVQKWISLYMNGWEAFAEYRRTGYPQLMKWDLVLNGLIITSANWVEVPRNYLPGRLPYPDTEVDFNEENYKDAVASQGGDDYYQQVWWAKKFGIVNY